MTANWLWVEGVARLLTRDERDAVIGDLLENGESAGQAFLSVLGLVVRREAQRWKSWRPWIAAFGLALPSTFLLMGLSVSVSWMFPHMLHAISEIEPHTNLVTYSILHLVPQLLWLAGCAYACGFVVGALSRRTLLVSATACFVPCLFCLARFRSDSLPAFCLFLFLVPAVLGVREAMRGKPPGFPIAVGLAVGLTVFEALMTNNSWLNWLWVVPVLWPSWYMVAIARRKTLPT